ncbi:MAG: iron ABC transporter permease, partial [Pseudolabrys sp.]
MTTLASTAPVARRRFGFDLSKPVLLAFALILCGLIVMPLSWLVYYAFTDKSGAFTVGNFYRLVSDAAYFDPLLTT